MNHSLNQHGLDDVLHVGGDLDALSSAELRPTLEVLSHDMGHNLTVDLSKLTLIDSSGIGALISLY